MDPVTAGIIIGGSFLSSMMNQQSQVNAQKKQMAVNLAQQGGQMSTGALGNLMDYYKSALGG